MVIAIPIVVILIIYFYRKQLARNASSKDIQQTEAKKNKDTEGGLEQKELLSFSQKEGEIFSRDPNVAPHEIFPDYLILYCDGNGATTERRITIKNIDNEMIQAYCHLRHARRSFYISRVSRWINCDSGEIVLDIFKDLEVAIRGSAYGTALRMREDLYPAMGVLYYLCKGDSRLMANERKILIKVFSSFCNDSRLTEAIINDGINNIPLPSRTRYKNLVRELSAMDPETQSLVLDASLEIFSSRKKLNPIEEEALNELNTRLSGGKKQSSTSESPGGEVNNQ